MTTTPINELQDGLQTRLRGDEALVLYGSYARGDFDGASDFDVLRIARSRSFRERIDHRVSLHSYSVSDLLTMSRNGSLFVLHLLQEGSPLHDPQGLLSTISSSFQRPVSYLAQAQETLVRAAQIIESSELLFSKFPDGVYGTALFLCRTLVYAEHADRGPFSFSLRDLAAQDATASLLLRLKHSQPSYANLLQLRSAVHRYLRCPPNRPEASSLLELARACRGDSVAESLLRRLPGASAADPYMMPPNKALQQTAAVVGRLAASVRARS